MVYVLCVCQSVCFWVRAAVCVCLVAVKEAAVRFGAKKKEKSVCDCLVSKRKSFSVFGVMTWTHCIDWLMYCWNCINIHLSVRVINFDGRKTWRWSEFHCKIPSELCLDPGRLYQLRVSYLWKSVALIILYSDQLLSLKFCPVITCKQTFFMNINISFII